MPSARRLYTLAIGMVIVGCEQREHWVGETTLSATPTLITLSAPITRGSSSPAVCVEFAPPGDSHHVGDVSIVMHAANGERDSLRGTWDRIGESTVCLRNALNVDRSPTYVAAILSARRPLRIRSVYLTSN